MLRARQLFLLFFAIVILILSFGLHAADSRASALSHISERSASLPAAGTIVSSDITTNTEWTAANSPYDVGQISVAAGVTLTIDSGVTVQFADYTGMTVNGTLMAMGTITAPITFGPGGSVGWNGVEVAGTSTALNTGSTLTYVTITGAGQNNGADLILNYAHATIDHSTFKDSGSEGIRGLAGGSADISNSSFANNGVNDLNGGYAIWFHDPTVESKLSNLTATGNRFDAIGLGDAYSGQFPITGLQEWTAAGIPYQLAGTITSAAGSKLTVDPGVTMQFNSSTWLTLNGRLVAEGSSDMPIVFEGTSSAPGSWNGIWLTGQANAPNDGSSLSYVTISGAGAGGYAAADLVLTFASASIAHSVISNSSADGIHVVDGTHDSVIQTSQIMYNANYGIRNDVPDKLHVLAVDDWWGDPSGPSSTPPLPACAPTGTGSLITTGVDFLPFLTSATGAPNGPVPTEINQVTIAPAAWFSPPDGVTRDYLAITVRDGSGHPLANQSVHVTSDLGTVVDGDVTGPTGQTFAYITSNTAGDAHVTAKYIPDPSHPCTVATSPSTTITFQPVDNGSGLVDQVLAPYDSADIIVPQPAVRGVAGNVGVRLRNPSTTNAISVSVDIEFAQSGIGLAFGPVGQVSQVIPPGGQADITVPWTPAVSGHYCFQVNVVAEEIASSSAYGVTTQPLQQFVWHGQRNMDVRPAALGSGPLKDAIQKSQQAGDAIEDGNFVIGALTSLEGIAGGLVQGTMVDQILGFIHGPGGTANCALAGGTQCGGWDGPHFGIGSGLPGGSLSDDPPRSDYRVIATIVPLSYPTVSTSDGIPAGRVQPLNDFVAASVDLTEKLRAAVLSLDRYGGASAAGDVSWASQQTGAYLYYKRLSGEAMIDTANKLDALQQELKNEGYTDFVVTTDQILAYQDRLRTLGFSSDELTAAQDLGLTDDVIEGIRQDILAEDPVQKAGGQFARWTAYAAALRWAGGALATTLTFNGGSNTFSAASVSPQAASDNLIQSYENTSSIQLANPLGQTATIDLRARPIQLPQDWMIHVSPSEVTLAPGQQITVTVTVQPGLSGVQGTQPRVAVEGYANGQLLGGVEVGVLLPQEQLFDGHFRVYIPAVMKNAAGGK